MATLSGITLPGQAPTADPSKLPFGNLSQSSNLSLGGGFNPASYINPSFKPGFSAINPTGGIVPNGIPTPAKLQPSTAPTSAVRSAPVSYGTSSKNTTGASYAPTTTSTGSTVMTDGSGSVASPTTFKVDTSGPVTSNALNSPLSAADVMGSRKTYADYVNGLSQAQQYSPEYLQALQASQAAKGKESELNTNFYTGNNLPGDTLDYAQGSTARAIQLNSQKQLAANQALQVQELVRQGNIAGAKALVDAYAPTNVAPGSSLVNPVTGQEQYSGLGGYQAVQGIQTVNNLAQNYPDANILPGDTLAQAQQKAQGAPSFTARQTYLQQLAGGQTVSFNKLTGQGVTIQGAGDASAVNAASKVIADLTLQKANVQAAVTTADQNFPLLINAAKQAGVNNSSPLVNQLQQRFGKNFSTSPAFAALQTLLPSLQTEYARILSRGGAVTDSERANSTALINGTYSVAQLQAVYNTVKQESSNVIAGYQSQINSAQSQLGGGSSAGSSGTSVGNSWANLH